MAGIAKRGRADVTRVAVLRDPALTAGTAQFAAIQAVAPSLGVEVSPIDMRNAAEIANRSCDVRHLFHPPHARFFIDFAR